jgi:hypothetical protein
MLYAETSLGPSIVRYIGRTLRLAYLKIVPNRRPFEDQRFGRQGTQVRLEWTLGRL